MLACFPGFSGGGEHAVETVTLLDKHFWLSGQGVAGHHPPIPSCPGIRLAAWAGIGCSQRKEWFLSSEPWVELFLQVWSQERIAVSFSIFIKQ